MVTLWPIPEKARETLEDGDHVKLTLGPEGRERSVVVGFEEQVDEGFDFCDWEVENGWRDME